MNEATQCAIISSKKMLTLEFKIYICGGYMRKGEGEELGSVIT